MEETSLPKTESLAGYITIVTVLLGVVCFFTFSFFDDNIDNLQETLHTFAANKFQNILYLVASVLFLVSLVGMSSLYFLIFRFYNPILGSFISFGFFASAVSVIISSSAALSFYQLLGDFLLSTNYQADMIAINMMSIYELKIKSLLIAGTFFGLSMVFQSVVKYISGILPLIFSILSSFSGIAMVFAIWRIQSAFVLQLVFLVAALTMVLNGIYLIIHSKKLKL